MDEAVGRPAFRFASDDALDGDQVARYLVQLRPAREGESLDPEDESLILDPKNAVEATVYDLSMGVDPSTVAARFHAGFAAGVARAAIGVARASGLTDVALGGGSFANRLLLSQIKLELESAGLRVLLPNALPINDGGVSYGQAAVARARLEKRGR